MSEDNKTRFGNMPLGMINKMLVSFIGEDAFLDYCEKYHKDWELDWQSREAFRRRLDRLFEEKEGEFSYRDLNPCFDQSVYRIAYKILDDFYERYSLSPYIFNILATVSCNLITRLCRSEIPIFETHYILLYEICQNVLPHLLEKAVNEIGKNNGIGFSHFDAETKYNMAFYELGKKFTSLEKFYTKLSNWYAGNNNKKNVFSDHFKKIIINNCKKGQNPAKWKDMKAILDFCKNEEKTAEMSCLIEAYLTANAVGFIKNEIPNNTLEKIKNCLGKIGDVFDKSISSGETLQNQDLNNLYDLADRLLYDMEPTVFENSSINWSEDHFKPIDRALSEILINHIYLQDEKKAEDLISNIEKVAPEASGFYCNWLRAYIEVAKGELKMAKAKELYSKAFSNIHFAGILAWVFLKQAAAFSIYCDSNPDTVYNAIPLPIDGQRFWEYGHAIGVFDKPAEETYLEYVYRKDNFTVEFPREMFFPGKEINTNRIVIENIKEKIEEEYNRLAKLKDKSINTRLRIFDADDVQRRPPLSMAMWLFDISSEGRFLDLIERWLGLSDPKTAITKLKFNATADLDETPLNAATMAYKNFCLKNSDPESPVKKRLKKIISHILDKTEKDCLEIATKIKWIHPLQNVIDSCDIGLVKEFVEKFVEVKLDIDSIRFTPDKLSPIYYTINRISKFQDPKRAARAMLENPENTNWEYADVQGINAEDRKRNFFEKMNHFPSEIQQLIAEYAIREDLGNESTYGEQIEKLKEICLYLIDHTNKREEYIKLFESCGADLTINSADELKKQP